MHEVCSRRPAASGRRNRWRPQGFEEDRRARHLAKKVDFLIIGGMVNTFLFAKGSAVGKSLHEPGAVSTVEDIQRKAAEAGCKILLPVDAAVASELKANVETAVVPVTEVPAGKMILDVGPASVKDPADIMLRSSSAIGGDG